MQAMSDRQRRWAQRLRTVAADVEAGRYGKGDGLDTGDLCSTLMDMCGGLVNNPDGGGFEKPRAKNQGKRNKT